MSGDLLLSAVDIEMVVIGGGRAVNGVPGDAVPLGLFLGLVKLGFELQNGRRADAFDSAVLFGDNRGFR